MRASRWRAALGEARSLAGLAAPLVAGLALSTAIMLVDTIMLGPLGAVPLAAASLTSSVMIICYATLYGFSGPIGLLAGHAHGADAVARVGRVARHGVCLALCAGVIAAALMAGALLVLPRIGQPPEVIAAIGAYWLWMSATLIPYVLTLAAKNLLDATDRPWISVLLLLVPLGLNIVFNWVLIYGRWGLPPLGLTGAGLASFCAQAIGAVVMWSFVRFAPGLRDWWTSPGLARAEFREQWREGLPMTAQYLMESAAVGLAGVLIGYFGAIALAGNQIALSVGTVLYMLPLGMAGAVTIRIAQAAGAKEPTRIAAIGYAGVGIVTLWMGFFALVFLAAGPAIAALFVDDPLVIAAAAGIFFVFGFTQVVDGVQSVTLGALRGMLDNQWPTRVSLVAYWLVALPVAWLLAFPLGLGVPGVWGGFGAGLAVAAVALSVRFARLTR